MWLTRDKDNRLWVHPYSKPVLHTYVDRNGVEQYRYVTESQFEIDKNMHPSIAPDSEPIEVKFAAVNKHTCSSCGKTFEFTESDIIDDSEPECENFWIHLDCPYCGRPTTDYELKEI